VPLSSVNRQPAPRDRSSLVRRPSPAPIPAQPCLPQSRAVLRRRLPVGGRRAHRV